MDDKTYKVWVTGILVLAFVIVFGIVCWCLTTKHRLNVEYGANAGTRPYFTEK